MPATGRSGSANSTTAATSTSSLRRAHPPHPVQKGRYRWYGDYELPHLRSTARHHPTPWHRRRHQTATQPHRERPAHPTRRPRLRTALRPPQRRRIHQPPPRRHHVARPRPQRRPRTPTLNLLGFALTVNALALHQHRRHWAPPSPRNLPPKHLLTDTSVRQCFHRPTGTRITPAICAEPPRHAHNST